MISVYLFCGLLFPIMILYGCKKRDIKGSLLEISDSQYLRGVSAWFVLISHYTSYIKENLIPVNALGKIFSFITDQLGGIGVLIFFFVSGYGIYVSSAPKEPKWNFLLKRIANVYLPYLAINFLLIFMNFILTRKVILNTEKILSILLAEDYWFIPVIMLQYLAFFVAWKFLNKKILSFGFLFNAVLTIIFLFRDQPDRWFNGLWLFTIGMMCGKYKEKLKAFLDNAIWATTGACFSIFGCMGLIFVINKGLKWANIFKIGGGIFLCIGILGVLRLLKPDSEIMRWFGRRSLYLYIVHIGVWPMIESENTIAHFWIAIAVSILITEVIYQMTILCSKNIFREKQMLRQ